MSSLKDQIEYSEQELRAMRDERIRQEQRDQRLKPAVIQVLERIEKQLTDLHVAMSEVSRILRTE